MSVDLVVCGIKPPTEEYTKKLEAWKACEAAGVEIPKEVDDFFNGEEPEPSGMRVELPYDAPECCTEWYDENGQGYEIDLSKLPKGVAIIRAYLS